MVEYKVNIGHPKSGKTHKKDIVSPEADALLGKKIGDKVKGDDIGFSGYEFEIKGGSDSSGFPMRWDVSGPQRKKILITKGIGNRKGRKGTRLRRTVVGNTIGEKTVQINLKVLKEGKEPLEPKPEAPEGEAPTAEAKPEEKKEEPKAEEKKQEAPKEEAKKE